jgi:hypothetical protein
MRPGWREGLMAVFKTLNSEFVAEKCRGEAHSFVTLGHPWMQRTGDHYTRLRLTGWPFEIVCLEPDIARRRFPTRCTP